MKIPKQYKEGFVDFLGCRIDLSHKPFIPRPETAYWTSLAIKEMGDNAECLDLFSGSGCIGVSILNAKEKTTCDFAEIDDKCLKQIEKNLKGIDKKRYNIIKSDIFSNVKKRYDYILANPPYVAEDRIAEVGKDVLKFEPHVALFSGPSGMNAIRIMIKETKDHLKEGGKLILEFDESQTEEIEDLIKENGYENYELFKDQFDQVRFIKIW